MTNTSSIEMLGENRIKVLLNLVFETGVAMDVEATPNYKIDAIYRQILDKKQESIPTRAEGEGFEPTRPVKVTVFKTVAMDHSATLPIFRSYIVPFPWYCYS